jgi:hypothetical protein
LLEVSAEAQAEKRMYRLSRILPHLLSEIQLPEAPNVYALYQTAHDALHPLWGHQDNHSVEQWRELFRLKFANRDNPKRFRQGFSSMVAIQFHRESDRAFDTEIKKVSEDVETLAIIRENLQEQKWRVADEETAWIFYQVMIIEGVEAETEHDEDWGWLMKQFPGQRLKEINQLWSKYSQGRFGFSAQKKIINKVMDIYWSHTEDGLAVSALKITEREKKELLFEIYSQVKEALNNDLGFLPKSADEVDTNANDLDIFAHVVNWRENDGSGLWLEYPQFIWNDHDLMSFCPGHLPVLCYMHCSCGGGWCDNVGFGIPEAVWDVRIRELLSRSDL